MPRYRQYTPEDDQPLTDGDSGWQGVNLRLDPRLLPKGMAAGARNLRFRNGKPQARGGAVKLPSFNNCTPGSIQIQPFQAIYGAGEFNDPDEVYWEIIAASGGVSALQAGNLPRAVGLPPLTSIDSPVWIVQAYNDLLMFRGERLAPLMLSTLDGGFDNVRPASGALNYLYADTYTVNQAMLFPPNVGFVYVGTQSYGAGDIMRFTDGHHYLCSLAAQTISSITWLSSVATVTTSAAHHFVTNEKVKIAGAAPSGYDGTFTITVTGATTFTYALASNPGSETLPGTATLTATLTGQSPATNPAYWTDLTYNPASTYSTNKLTVYQATLFSAIAPVAAGQDPFNNPDVWTPVTSQVWECTSSGATPGQTPVTTPASWNYVCDCIPNSAFAYYYQNMLWVITDRDLVKVSNVLDYTAYQPQINALRINEGSADALVCVYKYNDTTLFAFKEQSVYIVSGIDGTLANIELDTLTTDYGIAGPRAVTLCGQDLWFFSTTRGITSFTQTELNQIHGADVPKSEAIQPLIDRVNWTLAAGIQMFWHDNYLYVAVPLDDGTVTGNNRVPAGSVYTLSPTFADLYYFNQPVQSGGVYVCTSGPSVNGLVNDLELNDAGPYTGGLSVPGGEHFYEGANQPVTVTAGNNYLVLRGNSVAAAGAGTLPITAAVQPFFSGVNNAILVFDFMQNQWAGYDEGEAIQPLQFFRNIYGGATRLFFVGADGYVNLYEEGTYDQIAAPTDDPTQSAIGAAQIETTLLTRSYLGSTLDQKKFTRFSLQVETWYPNFSLTAIFAGTRTPQTLLAGITRSRTDYIRPFDAPAYVEGNVNGDHDTPDREDYSVDVSEAATYFDQGLTLDLSQQQNWRGRMRGAAPGVQFELTNASGLATALNIEVEANPGLRREGTI